MNGMQRVIGKHALVIAAKGQTEYASQVFVYDQMREIRADIEKLEVRVLMSYDKDYFRVFKVEVNEHLTKEKAQELVLNFYNNLLNSAMKLSKEEVDNLKQQQMENFKKAQEIKDQAEVKQEGENE